MGLTFTASMKVNPGIIERAKALLAGAAAKVSEHDVTIGIHDGSEAKVGYNGENAAVSLVTVAMWHEYGYGLVPSRSFLRQWHDTNNTRIKKEMKAAMQKEYAGDKSAVHVLAKRWAEEVRQIIESGATFEALTKQTVARKAAAGLASQSKPLIATRQLVNAIGARVDGTDV